MLHMCGVCRVYAVADAGECARSRPAESVVEVTLPCFRCHEDTVHSETRLRPPAAADSRWEPRQGAPQQLPGGREAAAAEFPAAPPPPGGLA